MFIVIHRSSDVLSLVHFPFRCNMEELVQATDLTLSQMGSLEQDPEVIEFLQDSLAGGNTDTSPGPEVRITKFLLILTKHSAQ